MNKNAFSEMREPTEESLKNVIKDSHIEALAKQAGLTDLSERLSTGLDSNEDGFVSFYKGKVHQMSEIVERRLNLIQAEVREIKDSLLNGTKAALVAIEERDLEPELKNLEVYFTPKVAEAATKKNEADRIYRYFRVENSVLDRLPKAPVGTTKLAIQFICFTLFEAITLASFYADLTEGGLVGGAGLAGAISILNILLGFVVGSVARQFNSKKVSRKLFSSSAGVLLFGSLLLFSIALAGQFRFAAKEQIDIYASEGPDKGIYTGKSSDTTVITHYQGDEEARPQWIARRAFENTVLHGFVVRDAMSGWVTLLTILFAALAIYKAYGRLDPTPDYWEKFDDLQKSKEAADALKKEHLAKVNEVFEARAARISNISVTAENSAKKIEELFNKLEEEERKMVRFLNETEAACINSLQKYRDTKRLVATNASTHENNPETSFDGLKSGFREFSNQVRAAVGDVTTSEIRCQVTETHRSAEAALQRLTERKKKTLATLVEIENFEESELPIAA